jgi:hypothetical protein
MVEGVNLNSWLVRLPDIKLKSATARCEELPKPPVA